MFDYIGEKIKVLAKVICWIGIIASVIGGIAMFVSAANASRGGGLLVFYGYLVIIGGSLLSWIGSWVLYAFGELVSNTQDIAAMLRSQPASTPAAISPSGYAPSVGASASDDNYFHDFAGSDTRTAVKSWVCSCGAKNSVSLDYCQACRKKRPV